MLIDTHCHLDFPEFAQDLPSVIERAGQAGVKAFVNVGSSVRGCAAGAELASRFPSVYFSAGIHPHHAEEYSEADLAAIERLIGSNEKLVAIGEVGLDYYRNIAPKEKQIELFRAFLRMKKKSGLPLIVHSREASADTLAVIREELGSHVDGVMHCFSEGEDFLKSALDLGFHISFTCNITFKNAGRLREVVKLVPGDRLMIETDAPYLAPQAMRGKRNEPAYLSYLVAELSSILGLPGGEIEDLTYANAVRFLKLEGRAG